MKKINWKTLYDDEEWLVEYDEETNQYRVTLFENYHFQDEIIFKGVEK